MKVRTSPVCVLTSQCHLVLYHHQSGYYKHELSFLLFLLHVCEQNRCRPAETKSLIHKEIKKYMTCGIACIGKAIFVLSFSMLLIFYRKFRCSIQITAEGRSGQNTTKTHTGPPFVICGFCVFLKTQFSSWFIRIQPSHSQIKRFPGFISLITPFRRLKNFELPDVSAASSNLLLICKIKHFRVVVGPILLFVVALANTRCIMCGMINRSPAR